MKREEEAQGTKQSEAEVRPAVRGMKIRKKLRLGVRAGFSGNNETHTNTPNQMS
ncbi:MAG TPA: hypothetical protein VFS43_28785 [Polyangiaceae bacterium]|nr:hypothetical protein [Polyangiaceae bacterium]